jgi:hypothetical protein
MMRPALLPLLVVVYFQHAICASKHNVQPENATVAVLRAFENHDVVMIGEIHANKQEYDWYRSLVATPEFADRVDDVVLEAGNSLYQHSVDQYAAGEDIPLEEVQKAWRNTVGLIGPPSPLIEDLYAAVREANIRRRGKHQIRIICGDPPLDWRQVKDTINDLRTVRRYSSDRDAWYARVVQEQVLAKHHRALLIMGAMHFLRNSQGPSGANASIERVLRKRGARTYVILSGTNTPNGCSEEDHRFDSWPTPSIGSARGWVGELSARSMIAGGYSQSRQKLKDAADALLYLGPRHGLTSVSMTRAQLDGTAYGKEIERRLQIEMILQPGEAPIFPEKAEEPQFPFP